ncbi:Ctr copper transporter [Cristinia sonorae]|uniref:Copper transport protein n=1 Tax=Cristinia sonorae TaxID=1940300 RepID=A0A8K0XUT4_9AGAR|nr:Ctr copper transporter [Cristinia sonorae]
MPSTPVKRCSMNMLWYAFHAAYIHTDFELHVLVVATIPPKLILCTLHRNTQIEDTCVVFRSWHIYTKTGFILSCLVIVFLGIFYEWLRVAQKNLDVRIAAQLSAQSKGKGRDSVSADGGDADDEEAGLLTGLRGSKAPAGTPIPLVSRISRAALYGSSVFLSFFLMLVFMTYNAYLILATVLGAAIGHFIFSPTMDIEAVLAGGSTTNKGMACH